MFDPRPYTEYKTVNSGVMVFTTFENISHINKGNDDQTQLNGETCWIHFKNGKCIHVAESYHSVVTEWKEWLEFPTQG